MAIIPRYTSRALPPGAQPGLITGAQSRGEAGAGLAKVFGGAVVEGIDYARRRDLAAETATKTTAETKAAAKLTERIAAEKRRNENQDHRDGETALVAAEAEITKGRARAVASAKTGGVPAKDMARISLADFDGATGKQAEALKTRPHLKARFDAMVESSRAPHELRMLTLENERRAGEEKTVLAAALGELAAAAADDPAMAPGVAGRGLAQIESAMDAGMVTPEEAAAMQGEFADNVHMAAMRGQIAADPALALAKLESGEFNDIFEAPARDRLLGEARTTARVKQAGKSAAARAKRRGLENDMKGHLAALDETGAADNAVAARALAELPDFQYAAFQQGQAQSRERHATRAEYAFMTADEIEADIAQQAPGGGPRDTDERAAAHAIRAEVRDEVLAARAEDPAGWAMRDEAVAAAFAAAQENPDDPASARMALALRLALQREMGVEQSRLLSEAEREEIAGQLAQATPADRPAIIADLRVRYGQHAGMLAAELTSEVDANTALLIAHAEVPHLPRLIAEGMEKAKKDGPATLTLASPEALNDLPPLPLVETGVPGGYRLDISNLKSGWTYRAPGGAALFYNGEVLVPATVEIAPAASPTGTFGAPGPAPVEIEPLLPPMAPRDLPALAPDVNSHAEEAAEAGDPPVDLEVEHASLPTGKEEDEGTLGHETNGVDEVSRENATERPNDFHPGTEQRDKEQMLVAADRQDPPHDEVSSDQPASGPQSAPGTNSYTNEKSVDGLQGREPENPSAAVDNTKKEPAVEWASVRNFVTGKETFKTNGPVKIGLNSMTLGLDGLRYTVDWHPLDKNGNRAAAVQAEDYRPPEYGGHVLPGIPSETIIEPPYDNPYGFEVTVNVPPQERNNDNSSGPYLNIYQLK